MTRRPDEIQALLSGMLDGVLSPAEQDLLEQALRADPSLQQELDALTAMRSSLLKGRRQGRLGSQFSERVIQAASMRASYDPELAPDWVPSTPRPPLTTLKADEVVPLKQRLWQPALAVAAAFLIAMFTMQLQRMEKRQVKDGLASTQTQASPESETASEGKADSPVAPLSPQESPATAVESSVAENSSQLQENELKLDKPFQEEPAAGARAADTIASMSTESLPKESLDNESTAKPSPHKDASEPAIPAYVLMAVHVSQTGATADGRGLQALLEKHNIVANDDLAISDEELETLLATGAAGKIENKGENVYFLKGFAKNLSGAIEELCAQYKNFPDFGINITIDNSAKILVQQLEEIDLGEAPAVALKVGVQTPNGFVSSFAPGRTIPKPMSHQRREHSPTSNMLGSIDTNPVSYLLLIVRTIDQNDDSSPPESSSQSSPQGSVAD